MNLYDTIQEKLTMLQDDFGDEEEVDESVNSDAPDEPAAEPPKADDPPSEEPNIEEAADEGTKDDPDAPPKAEGHHESHDCDVTFFGDCEMFTYW
jgi:hypothetical protein